MDYTINQIQVHSGAMPVKLIFSYGPVDSFPFTIIRLSAGGVEGIGEAMGPANDFLDSLMSNVLGRDARRMEALLPATNNVSDRILCEGTSIALHDLVGKISGLPAHVLLGGKRRDRVPLMPCLFPRDPDDAARQAEKFLSQGYQQYFKVKLLGELKEDLARIAAIRSVVPKELVIQGDANEGYQTFDQAQRAVLELGQAGLDIFEDPLLGETEDYCRLRRALAGSGAKIMTDRLARRTKDLADVLKADAADVIGIHADQPGSMRRVVQHVSMAQAFGVPMVIGGTGYTGIGTAAYQHLTAVVDQSGPCGELGGYLDHGMPDSMVETPLPIVDGCVEIPDTPGLGIKLDHRVLAKYAREHKTWTT